MLFIFKSMMLNCCILQNNSPIYNLATGLCLGIENKKPGTEIIMELCTEVDKTMWDLVR